MTAENSIELLRVVVWPIVALLSLLYVWRTDALKSLLKISVSVEELKGRVSELVAAEERLSQSAGSIVETTDLIKEFQNEMVSIKADVERIRDQVDSRTLVSADSQDHSVQSLNYLNALFNEIEGAWQRLTKEIESKFGWFDKRMTAAEVYRFAHGNRKGMKLSYEQVEEISSLHSSIKSYRRRQSDLEGWLDKSVRDDFVNSCDALIKEIASLSE